MTSANVRSGWRAYLLHLRPAEWPVMTAHVALGWLLAEGVSWPPRYAWVGIAVWVVLLNGGTLALNSAFDRDTGDVAFLRNPPPAPRYLASFAVALMLLGGLITRQYPATYRRLYLVCAVLSVAYSVPPIRLKAIGGLDWLVNMVGFGTLTVYAGWAMSGRALHGAMLVVLCAFTPLFAALYPLTQLYQMDDDRARGDRTLALRLGARRSLMVAVFAAGLAFGMFAMAAWRTGWTMADLLHWGALAVAALAWLIVLLPWFTNATRWSSREHEAAMYHALAAWALTDIAVFLAWAT